MQRNQMYGAYLILFCFLKLFHAIISQNKIIKNMFENLCFKKFRKLRALTMMVEVVLVVVLWSETRETKSKENENS